MFITLLTVTFLIAAVVSFIVAQMFKSPVEKILHRIINDPISAVWVRYLKFALYTVGISSGVRIWDLEKYITPRTTDVDKVGTIIELTGDRWVLEVYRTIIETLQGIAWMLLVFFLFALIAYVVVRLSEAKKDQTN